MQKQRLLEIIEPVIHTLGLGRLEVPGYAFGVNEPI